MDDKIISYIQGSLSPKEQQSLLEESKNNLNKLDPKTFKVTLTPESIEALKAVIPYLDMP